MHTVSVVGYNVQLSGGLESRYITAVLATTGQKIRTNSVELPRFKKDKSIYQQKVSKMFKTEHYSIKRCLINYSLNLDKMTWHPETPLVHGRDALLMNLSYFVQKSFKVIISEEGADELFGGYSRYKLTNKYKTKCYLKKLY